MTKVRTREECLGAIQSDSVWRKREIIQLGFYVSSLSGIEQNTALRAALVMLYAHWEGFIKSACLLYIIHINELLRRNQIELSPHFKVLREWKIYREGGAIGSNRNPVKFINIGKISSSTRQADLPEDVIDTESNLNSLILKRLFGIMDLDYSKFQLREKLIDEVLLAKRNSVAHGERISISMEDYSEAEKEIKKLIDEFQQMIEIAVTSQAFRKI